jgi:TetR/AcrR family transcriptional regulator, transcriptional repressor for nem operon
MLSEMAPSDSPTVKEKLVQSGIDLFRRTGYVATTVDDICRDAGVSKGAFFHYFENKDALAEECLSVWGNRLSGMFEKSAAGAIKDPVERLFHCLDFFIEVFSNPQMGRSCLAGTIVQEVSESHPALREAANKCFTSGIQKFRGLLVDACRARKLKIDTESVARMFLATIQGSLLLAKASQDTSVTAENLRHYKRYVETLIKA